MRRFPAAAFLSLCIPSVAVAHDSYRLDSEHSDVTARVSFLGIGSRTAHFLKVSGMITRSGNEAINLIVRLDATALEASDALTERRLKGDRFFDAAHYPQVIFTGRSMTATGTQSGTIQGAITARGVTKPATLDVRFSRPFASAGTGPIHISATTRIDRRDFGMTAYSLIVGRHVTVAIEADLQPVD